jgi:hypothetical protein
VRRLGATASPPPARSPSLDEIPEEPAAIQRATRARLSEEAFAAAWAAGRALSLEEAVRFALDESHEG